MDLSNLKNFPTSPGVYIMKNIRKNVIYVGKAKDLKKRVSSYFNKKNQDLKTAVLLQKIIDIEFIVTKSELEALILECNLIKKFKPRYNILLKDDKSFPFIKIDLNQDFPRLQIVRNPNFRKKKQSEYFYGPFPMSSTLKENVRFLNKIFKLRTCSDSKMRNRARPCINYDIGLCFAPCKELISREEYSKQIKQALLFLKGRQKELLNEKMKEASDTLDFEKAASLRDRIDELKKLSQKQIITQAESKNFDVFAYHKSEERILIYTLFIRQGMILGGEEILLGIEKESCLDATEIPVLFETVLNQYYANRFVPDIVILPENPNNKVLLEESFSQIKGQEVRILVPQRGKNLELVELAFENAQKLFKQKVEKISQTENVLKEIKSKLHLEELPLLIECFDISNFNGANPVASKVVFRKGEADRKSYRHYKIKGEFGGEQNDFAMLSEVVQRAYRENEEDPNLILIDGGRGQLSVIYTILNDIGKKYFVASIAKARVASDYRQEDIVKSVDRIFIPGRKNPVGFKSDSQGLQLLSRIRDEAHRFAITFNRKLALKEFTQN